MSMKKNELSKGRLRVTKRGVSVLHRESGKASLTTWYLQTDLKKSKNCYGNGRHIFRWRKLKVQRPWGRDMGSFRKIKETSMAGTEWVRERVIRDEFREEAGMWNCGGLWAKGRHDLTYTLKISLWLPCEE